MATAVWRGQLTFGLLSFPVKLYAAARRDPVSFRNLRKREEPEPEITSPAARTEPIYTPEERVTHTPVTTATEIFSTAPITSAPAPIVKGYEFEKDQFVAIDPAEIRKLAKSTSKDMEVTEFVHWTEIDPVFLDASYFVTPDPSGEKPYSLLYAAMKKTGFAAMAQIAMHGREQVLVLRLGTKGLVAHTMYYYSEVRRDEEFAASTDQLAPKELDLASKLIEHMEAPFNPEQYVDQYKARIQALVEEKVSNVAAQPAAAEPPIIRKKPVDIMDALKRSLKKAAERKAPNKPRDPNGRAPKWNLSLATSQSTRFLTSAPAGTMVPHAAPNWNAQSVTG